MDGPNVMPAPSVHLCSRLKGTALPTPPILSILSSLNPSERAVEKMMMITYYAQIPKSQLSLTDTAERTWPYFHASSHEIPFIPCLMGPWDAKVSCLQIQPSNLGFMRNSSRHDFTSYSCSAKGSQMSSKSSSYFLNLESINNGRAFPRLRLTIKKKVS